MARLATGDAAHQILYCRDQLDHAEKPAAFFVATSGGVLSEGYGRGAPGVCLGDGQTEAGGLPPQGGRGDALPRRMPPYRT